MSSWQFMLRTSVVCVVGAALGAVGLWWLGGWGGAVLQSIGALMMWGLGAMNAFSAGFVFLRGSFWRDFASAGRWRNGVAPSRVVGTAWFGVGFWLAPWWFAIALGVLTLLIASSDWFQWIRVEVPAAFTRSLARRWPGATATVVAEVYDKGQLGDDYYVDYRFVDHRGREHTGRLSTGWDMTHALLSGDPVGKAYLSELNRPGSIRVVYWRRYPRVHAVDPPSAPDAPAHLSATNAFGMTR